MGPIKYYRQHLRKMKVQAFFTDREGRVGIRLSRRGSGGGTVDSYFSYLTPLTDIWASVSVFSDRELRNAWEKLLLQSTNGQGVLALDRFRRALRKRRLVVEMPEGLNQRYRDIMTGKEVLEA